MNSNNILIKIGRFVKVHLERFIKNAFYNLICNTYIRITGNHDNRTSKYYLSLCLIFKNEAPFLKEWLDYHLAIGVDHFYLYDNNSDDQYRELIEPYVNSGLVTLIEFPYDHAQMKAYEDCYNRYKEDNNWISFLDADEFICPKKCDNIKNWLRGYDKYPAIMINWLMFGTGGVIEHDYNKNVIEQYHLSWEHLHPFGKCIINTRWDVASFNNTYVHHHTIMKYKMFGIEVNLPAVDQFKRIHVRESDLNRNKYKKEQGVIQINHYFTKAWNIYSSKIRKTDVVYKKNPKKDIDYFYKFESKCTHIDYSIYRYIIKLKFYQNIIGINDENG